MADFTMLFIGLILHYGEGIKSKTAVLVDVPHHTPELVIPADVDPIDECNWPSQITQYGRAYDLKGRKVTIEDIDQLSNMKIDYHFYRRVPNLKGIFEPDDAIVLSVERKEIKDGVTTAFVDYSGGELSIFDYFCKEVRSIPPASDDPHCLARTVRFDGTTTGSTIKINDGLGGYIVLPDQIKIRIQNIAEEDGLHQREYRRLMTKKKLPSSIVETNRRCKSCSPEHENDPQLGVFPIPRSVSIECSNSQWP